MSHINTPELNRRFFINEVYLKAINTKILSNETKINYLVKNMNNESVISILASYENKIENMQNKLDALEKKLENAVSDE